MSRDDLERWDARHLAAAGSPLREPDPFFLRALARVEESLADRAGAPGHAADLACGGGRHALELARRGWAVTAVDISSVALAQLCARAHEEGLAIATLRHDLEAGLGPLRGGFELVVAVDFLERRLLAEAHRLLIPGGWLIFCAFTLDRPGDHPPDRWCLEPGELCRPLPGLRTLLYDEEGGRAGILGVRLPYSSGEDGAGAAGAGGGA
jgi:SAM-dependent methyltransferase